MAESERREGDDLHEWEITLRFCEGGCRDDGAVADATRGEGDIDVGFIGAAQLDAIARSDGTRASVTRELFRMRVQDGILGDIRFDENGDLVEGPGHDLPYCAQPRVVDRVVTACSR